MFWRRRRTGHEGINPASLSNLELRLDAAAIVAPSTAPFGDPLETWPDTSGNTGRDATQANAALRPNFVNFAGNGAGPQGQDLPCVFFNDAQFDNMHGILPAAMSVTNGATYYIWMRTFAKGTNDGQCIYCDETGGRPRLYWEDGTGASSTFTIAWGDALGTHDILATPAEGWYSVVYTFPPPAGTGLGKIHLNGSLIGAPEIWSHADNGDGYFLGSIQGGNLHLRARIFELLWYSTAHSDATRQGVSDFLSNKWGW